MHCKKDKHSTLGTAFVSHCLLVGRSWSSLNNQLAQALTLYRKRVQLSHSALSSQFFGLLQMPSYCVFTIIVDISTHMSHVAAVFKLPAKRRHLFSCKVWCTVGGNGKIPGGESWASGEIVLSDYD